ncbi:hypothetical protein CHUAL_006584 [Chamberlinius hualienensis]
MKYFQLLAVLLLAVTSIQGKVFTRCQLAKELINDGFAKNEINDWVCLVESESSRNTAAIGPPNLDGSQDYGLFQINSKYWCSGGPQSQHNGCGVPCSELTSDDISQSVKCVKKIYAQQGLSAWVGWNNKCKGKDLSSYTAGCKL